MEAQMPHVYIVVKEKKKPVLLLGSYIQGQLHVIGLLNDPYEEEIRN